MTNNKFKILLIEDELNIHSFMQTILEAEGYQVLKATTGAQGKLILPFSSSGSDSFGSGVARYGWNGADP